MRSLLTPGRARRTAVRPSSARSVAGIAVGVRRLGVFACAAAIALIACTASASASATRFGELGSEAGQVSEPIGVAVDAMGDVYVGDAGNDRLDKFDGSEVWQWASGVGVLDGSPELQTCTSSCLKGNGHSGSPEAFRPGGVAVDSFGDLYVVDEEHSRVLKFSPSGALLLMFGGKVNEEAGAANPDVCLAGEKCKLYAEIGTGNGEFSYMPAYGWNSFIAVGPGNAVYVGDGARVEVFEPSGAWRENISLAGLSAEARPTALAVDGSGDVFVKDAGVAGVREFEPNGTERSVQFDAASTSVTALAFDPASDRLFVGDSNGGFHVLEYDAVSGKQLASFAYNTLSGESAGLVFSSATGELYASSTERPSGGFGVSGSSVWEIPLPAAGPAVDRESATPELRGAVTLEGLVDPEGAETSVHFEYVDEAHFKESGYANAVSTTPVSVGSSFEDQSVSVHPTLVPGTVYHYRVVASSAQGTTAGEDESFQETPPASITGPWAIDVAGTSATLGAKIDPLGASTTYRLEYGTSASYGHSVSGSVGEGMGEVEVSHHFQGLEPTTEYHYRVVTSSMVGTWASLDRTFTTQNVGTEFELPDGRVWELVSPANKHDALIEPEPKQGVTKAAADGSGVAYNVKSPISEAPMGSQVPLDQALSQRGPDGWHTQEVEATQKLSNREYEAHGAALFGDSARFFSSDLSSVLVEPAEEDLEPLSPLEPGSEATERTLYLRDNSTGTYLPLVNPANVPPGTKFGGESKSETGLGGTAQEMAFLYATPDLSHVVFRSSLRLTPEAVEGHGECASTNTLSRCPTNLYEWSAGRLSLVDVLPDGKPLVGENADGAYLGRSDSDMASAVSNDGRWVVWSHGSIEHGSAYTKNTYPLYVRDMVHGETWQVGGLRPRFETMSGNGAWVFYWEGRELYAYDTNTHTATDVTANHSAGELSAGVSDGFYMNVSEDGTYVYYVATGVLAPGAVSGEHNLYVSHYDGTSWRPPTLVGTLSKADEPGVSGLNIDGTVNWEMNFARVSPNGRYLTFMSSRPLTGYDNMDISEQETEDQMGPGEMVKTRVHHDEEAFLYDAVKGRLVCMSCDPSGARPSGLHFATGAEGGYLLLIGEGVPWSGRWVAASFPKWSADGFKALYQPRYLSNSGRVFFNSPDALVPQDTNGVLDVYEYEPTGVGDCSGVSATFSERSDGCTSLISSGTSAQESALIDASENGNDVFFMTASKLVSDDYDTAYDVYDAHVCSASVPCRIAPVGPPACTSGDSCKPAPSPQPEIFGPAPSATFSGVGNFSETAKPTVTHRSLSRAQKLARALRACRKKKNRRKRAACAVQAHKRYGTKRSGKASSARRGK